MLIRRSDEKDAHVGKQASTRKSLHRHKGIRRGRPKRESGAGVNGGGDHGDSKHQRKAG